MRKRKKKVAYSLIGVRKSSKKTQTPPLSRGKGSGVIESVNLSFVFPSDATALTKKGKQKDLWRPPEGRESASSVEQTDVSLA